ncbi:MAG TPA: hypothetical protein GX702_12195 [Chloroflexi bacterium]|jgi:hypothetical protein|nr:hypothetical protein [Chloroflexota bacterium]
MSNLNELLARVRADLRDTAGEIWSDAELTAHLRRALHEYSIATPLLAMATLTAIGGQHIYPLTPLGDLLHVVDVWYPYDPVTPQHPPHRPPWQVLPGNRLYLPVDRVVAGIDHIAVHYARIHTLQGLDGALITTPDAYGWELLVWGATAHAAMQLAGDRIDGATEPSWTLQEWREWAVTRNQAFRRALDDLRRRLVLPSDARVAPVDGTV